MNRLQKTGKQFSLTSTRDIVLDTKISTGAPRVVTGCENDPPHCLYLADHTGDSWGGHDAILTNHQMSNLQEGAHVHRDAQINAHMYRHTKAKRERKRGRTISNNSDGVVNNLKDRNR